MLYSSFAECGVASVVRSTAIHRVTFDNHKNPVYAKHFVCILKGHTGAD